MIYLIILGLFLVISLFFEHKFKLRLYQSQLERFLIPLFFFIVGTAWDTFAVYNGHWYFNLKNLSGVKIGLLPLEEYLFFLIVPYGIITFYKVLQKKIK